MNNKNNNYTVYVHRLPKEVSNYEYDKYYVGLTSATVNKRWGTKGQGYYSNKYFKKDIFQFGWENFEHIIIAENLIPEQAGFIEKVLITILHSVDLDLGYNRTRGGEMVTVPARKKMSLLRLQQEEFIHGLPLEDQLMIKESRYKRGGEHFGAKEVHQFTIDGKYIQSFPSCQDAAKTLGVTPSTIYSVASHRAPSCKQSLLEYNNNVIKTENGYELIHNYYHVNTRCKPIVIYNKSKEFVIELPSSKQVAEYLHLHKKSIHCLIRHTKKDGSKLLIKENYYIFYKQDEEEIQKFLIS